MSTENNAPAVETAAQIDAYENKLHLHGKIWTIAVLAILLAVPFFICLIFDTTPDWATFGAAFFPLFILNFPGCVVEIITYSPLLGTGGTYLAFVTGNLSNLKIPCVMNSRDLLGTEIGTKENDIVSTISVATSAIVTTIVILIGVLLLAPLTPLLQAPVLQPAFNNVVPALFGAMGYKYFSQYPKVAVAPLLVCCVLMFLIPKLATQISIMIIVSCVISMGYALLLYKKKKL